MVVLAGHRVELVPEGRAEAVGREGDLLAAVPVLDVGSRAGRGVEGDLRISIVLGVEGEPVELPLDVVAHHCHLAESSVEGFSSGGVDDVAESEDIVVLLVLQGGRVDIEVSRAVGESCLREDRMSGGGHEGVEVSVGALHELASAVAPEDGDVVTLNAMGCTFLTSTRTRSFSMLMFLS